VPGTAAAQEVPKNRYEKLETRISSYLASLLQCTTFYLFLFVQMNSNQCSRTRPRHLPTSPPYQVFRLLRRNPNHHLFQIIAGFTNATISTPSSTLHTPDFGLRQDYQPSSLTFTGITPPLKSFIAPVDNHLEKMKVPTTDAVISEIQGDTTSFLSQSFGYDVLWPAWPRDLPSPTLVRHL
jgi:elongation factor P--beta-lysine ligase